MTPRALAIALAVSALACGDFDVNRPPAWATRIDTLMPAKRVGADELSGDCIGRRFARKRCDVAPSRSAMRKAVLRLLQGEKMTVTYIPGEDANAVIVSARTGEEVKVPVRRSGGLLELDCAGTDCIVSIE